MLQRILQSCRHFARSAIQTARVRQSLPLELCPLEQRATPAAVNYVAPVDAPVTVVVAGLPLAQEFSEVATKPIVRLDLTAPGTSTRFDSAAWSDLLAGDQAGPEKAFFPPKGPAPETLDPTPAANAEELALMEAEWAALQQG